MSSARKIYIAITLFALIDILLIIFVLLATFREIKEISQQFQLAKNKLNSLTSQEKKEVTFDKLYENYQPALEKIEKIFINPDLPLDLINFLEEIASSSQVQLTISSMTKETSQKDSWPALLLQISLSGSFSNSLQFLERLENSPYLIEVLDLTVQKLTEREAGSKEITTSNLLIKVFTR